MLTIEAHDRGCLRVELPATCHRRSAERKDNGIGVEIGAVVEFDALGR